MQTPTVDIIVPVWNNPFETRACLASILTHSPEARLIIVASGSSRETELMLEEFSEPLGERGLFIISDRNLGLVPSINMGLSRSDSDYAVILRPQVQVPAGWLAGLLEAARGGIGTPLLSGNGAPQLPGMTRGCTQMETFSASFFALALKGEMHMLLGGLDERLDNAEWCLKEYLRRAWSKGYRTSVSARTTLDCRAVAVFGSKERQLEIARASQASYLQRWGGFRHYGVYFGRSTEAADLAETIETILEGARQGHRFTLLLHRRQVSDFRRLGWNGLHTSIELQSLSLLAPRRDLQRKLAALQTAFPDMVMVRGPEGATLPAFVPALLFSEVAAVLGQTSPTSNLNGDHYAQ